ncbi:MAG: glycine zipper 2TM domain-containing protein [Magnetococcales bacterium]|nr:glycine zipper 2TM domain-containing protein [Magnetococcales bacterium]
MITRIAHPLRSKPLAALTLFVAMAVLSGCENRAQTGTGIGAMGGALAGSLLGGEKNKEQWALLGAAAGGLVGYVIGNEMDKADAAKMTGALERTRSYQTTRWVNPDSGNEYAVTPRPAFQRDGRNCREAEVQSVIDGKRETVVTTACRLSDGRWEIQR